MTAGPALRKVKSLDGPLLRHGVWYYVMTLECGHQKEIRLSKHPMTVRLAWCWECGREGKRA